LLVGELLVAADHARVKLFRCVQYDAEGGRFVVQVGKAVEQTVRIAVLCLQNYLYEEDKALGKKAREPEPCPDLPLHRIVAANAVLAASRAHCWQAARPTVGAVSHWWPHLRRRECWDRHRKTRASEHLHDLYSVGNIVGAGHMQRRPNHRAATVHIRTMLEQYSHQHRITPQDG
uniref:Uncharacterized protein n=1 Tax=Anopheles coluzzii TaxID=1518534 RepID=A0A8W7PF22_ANOCL